MGEYILIDVSKHDEEGRKTIRDFLLGHGLVVPRYCVALSEFEVVCE